MAWEVIVTSQLSHSLLDALITNEIAAIRVPTYLSPAICQAIVENITLELFQYYAYAGAQTNSVCKIGLVQKEHRHSPELKEQYFRGVGQATLVRNRIFEGYGDLLSNVMTSIKNAWGKEVSIAREGNLPYFAGVIRSTGAGAFHCDWAPQDARGWSIENVTAQLTWNIYLQMGTGGSLSLYRQFGLASHTDYFLPGSTQPNEHIVGNVAVSTVLPLVGDMILFNPRNYHLVGRTEGGNSRISFSSFFGLIEPSQKLIFWS